MIFPTFLMFLTLKNLLSATTYKRMAQKKIIRILPFLQIIFLYNLYSTTIYLWLISLTTSKELSILLLKLYNDGAIGMSASFLGLRVRILD